MHPSASLEHIFDLEALSRAVKPMMFWVLIVELLKAEWILLVSIQALSALMKMVQEKLLACV